MVTRLASVAAALAAVAFAVAASSGAAAERADGPRLAIYDIRPDGTGRRLVALPDPPISNLLRSPDRKRILFARFDEGKSTLYVADLSGANPVRLTPDSGFYGGAAFSPDGRKVAFSSYTVCGVRCQVSSLHAVNVDGSDLHRVAERGESPSWSPDGRRLAYRGSSGVHVVRATGEDDRVIGRNGLSPAWAPRGRRIAYIGFRGGYGVPCFVNADGSGRRCLRGLSAVWRFVWSPDAKRVAFAQAPQGWLVVYGADGRVVRRFKDQVNRPRPLAWSPDGRRIAYSYSEPHDAPSQIFVRPVARQSSPRRVTSESRDGGFVWQFGEVRWDPGRISYVIYV